VFNDVDVDEVAPWLMQGFLQVFFATKARGFNKESVEITPVVLQLQ
jgi:hypothetical protein